MFSAMSAALPIHVPLLAIFFMSGVLASFVFLQMWSKLDFIGETPVSRISFWATATTLQEYRRLRAQNSWPSWPPTAFWLCLFLAFISGFALVCIWKPHGLWVAY